MRNYNLQLNVPVLDGQFDFTINGEFTDTEQNKLPLMTEDNIWRPFINLTTGRIVNWTQGVTAEILIKAVDRGDYRLYDRRTLVSYLLGEYVPNMLSVGEEGFGDYIIMKIDETGKIENFVSDLSEFKL